jgi:hypothetical protein
MTGPLLLAEHLLAEYSERFMNRAYPYAVQQPDGTYRWRYEACTTQLLAAHLRGELTLAFSSTDTDGSCRWVCLDIDEATPDAFARVLALRTALAGVGLLGLVEASRRGGHLWLVLESPLPAAQARAAVFAALDGMHAHGTKIPHFELYPDTAAPEVLGHAVRVPLGLHQLTGRRYPLFDEEGYPCAFTSTEAGVRFVLRCPRIPAQVVAEWAARYHPAADGSEEGVPACAGVPGAQLSTETTVGTRSAVIRWVDSQVSLLDLLAELAPDVELRRMGRGYLGWCPFHDDRTPDGQGRPGTPSFYVVQDQRYGWSWRCLSTNCEQHEGPMRHSFRLLRELLGLTAAGAIRAARARWPEAWDDHNGR